MPLDDRWVNGSGPDGPYVTARELVQPSARLSKLSQGVWRDMLPDVRVIEHETAFISALDHPLECQIRQPRIRISPAHITVHAREPDLLHALGISRVRYFPQSRLKLTSLFVDSDGVTRVIHNAAQPHVMKLVPVPRYPVKAPDRDAERADRIPYTKQPYAGLNRVLGPKCPCLIIIRMHLARAVQLVGAAVHVAVLPAQQSAITDISYDAPRGIGATAEPKQREFIALFVVVDDESVSILNVGCQTMTERAARPFVDARPGADASAVKDNLRSAGVVTASQSPDEFGHVTRSRSVSVFLIRGVPGAVATDDQAFHGDDVV